MTRPTDGPNAGTGATNDDRDPRRGGRPRQREGRLTGRRRLLAAVAAGATPLVAGCLGDDDADPASPTDTAGSATVAMQGSNVFDPVRVSVPVGGTVTWENETVGTYADHTVTSTQFHDVAADWEMDETLGSRGSTSRTFDAAGVYEYYCTIHGEGMCGAVLVGDATLDAALPCE